MDLQVEDPLRPKDLKPEPLLGAHVEACLPISLNRKNPIPLNLNLGFASGTVQYFEVTWTETIDYIPPEEHHAV